MEGPILSQAERDRRWAALRGAMDQARIDCVVTPDGSGGRLQADSRYLTGLGGPGTRVACVFPIAGDVTAIADPAPPVGPAWAADVRHPRGGHGAAATERVRELPLRHARIGVAGLGGGDDGTAPHAFVSALQAGVTGVEWVDFTAELRAVRAAKSAEEIALIARSAKLVDAAFARAAATARPRAKDYEPWAAAMGALFTGGSEASVESRWRSGPRLGAPLTLPTHGELQRGYILYAELEAACAGYHAGGAQAFAVEDCDPRFKDLCAALIEYWEHCLREIEPGRPQASTVEACQRLGRQALPRKKTYRDAQGTITLAGCGLGSDLPLVSPGRRRGDDAGPIEPGWAFVFKVTLSVRIGGRPYFTAWADTVVVEESGPRRFGGREPGLWVAGPP